MPNGVSDTGWVALVCWTGTTFALLHWLALGVCEVPEIGNWFVDSAHHIIMGFTLVMHATEVNLAFISEGVPEGAL